MATWPPVSLPQDGKKVHLNKTTFQENLGYFRYVFAQINNDSFYLSHCRQNLTTTNESKMADVLNWYTAVNAAMLEHLTNEIKETDSSGVWR